MKRLLASLSCLLLFACSSDKDLAGASTVETENACTINVVNIDSKPAANVVARIRPLWYVEGVSSDSAVTQNNIQDATLEVAADSLGNIVMDSINFDKGYIEIIDGNSGVFQAIASSDLKKNKLTTMQMEELGSVTGKAELPEGTDYAWVQIYGTDKIVKTNKDGEFTLDSLPPASYQIRAILPDEQETIGEASITISAGENSDIQALAKPTLENEQLEQWAHVRTIPLDSTISDWMKPIAETTVVFVRLNETNFDFSEAMDNGNDIRFTDQSGNRLAFKRAFWNSTTPDTPQSAEFHEAFHLFAEAADVVLDRLPVQHFPHVCLAGGIPDHAGAAAKECDRPVAGHLQPLHQAECHEVAHMQAVRRGIKSDVKGGFSRVDQFPDRVLVRDLGNQTACL